MIFSIDDETRRRNIALIDGPSGQSWTYGQLTEETGRCAEALRSPRKGLVFHFCGNTLPSVAWYLGAIEAGQTVALLASHLEASLKRNLMDRFRPEFAVLPESPGEQYEVQAASGLWRRRDLGGSDPPIHADASLLLSTSGSTGSPKFVRLARRGVEANAASIQQALGLTEEDRPVAHLPLHYSYGLSVLNSHLAIGATIILTGTSLIEMDFWKAVARHRVSSFSGVPYTYQMLRRLDLDQLPADSIVSMTQAGGKLDNALALEYHSKLAARGGKFWVMYGQTEATARISILPPEHLTARIGSAGVAIPGGSLSIDTGVNPSAEPDVAGELVYRGPNVMLGYASERADLAKGDELGGVLYTGDRAKLDSGGYLYVLGRAARDAKVFGLRINMDEVEAMLKVHGPAAVVSGDDRLIVYCEFGSEVELQLLRAELSGKLRLHSSGLVFHKIGRLPTNSSGKIDYAQLGVP